MADPSRRLPTDVPGELFVDATCIDCAACRWIAPRTFAPAEDTARVHRQPTTPDEMHAALQALVSCPVGSIGTESKPRLAEAIASFPREVAPAVYHMGFHSRDSFGAASYLVVREEGNVLVDSPRFNRALVRGVEALGGVRTMFLTHQDDVADHARYAEAFGCERVMHADDVRESTREVERQLTGSDPIALADDLLVIPVPGHTRGSAVLLYDRSVLFSGDHLAWNRRVGALRAFRDACWYSWEEQRRSMERLRAYPFEHLFPGHGSPRSAPPEEMGEALEACIAWMGAVA